MFYAYTWPIYQASVYRTIGPLVLNIAMLTFNFTLFYNNRGIKHDFPFIYIWKVLREVLKTEGESRGLNLPEGPCEC